MMTENFPTVYHWPSFREQCIEALQRKYADVFATKKNIRFPGIACTVNGETYPSVAIAAEKTGIPRSAIENKLKGRPIKSRTQFTASLARASPLLRISDFV